jgi:hypothetical protein
MVAQYKMFHPRSKKKSWKTLQNSTI